LQFTGYAASPPLFLPFSEAYATTDLIALVALRAAMSLPAGVKNLLDWNYYFAAGYPEIGRNWVFNLRYHL
jgi:outer membrane receptor protein involved in Fe transport